MTRAAAGALRVSHRFGQVLQRYNAVLTQLPVMHLEDPVARYFALSRGDVLMCVRDSETAGKASAFCFYSRHGLPMALLTRAAPYARRRSRIAW